jgi:hypothetical protein
VEAEHAMQVVVHPRRPAAPANGQPLLQGSGRGQVAHPAGKPEDETTAEHDHGDQHREADDPAADRLRQQQRAVQAQHDVERVPVLIAHGEDVAATGVQDDFVPGGRMVPGRAVDGRPFPGVEQEPALVGWRQGRDDGRERGLAAPEQERDGQDRRGRRSERRLRVQTSELGGEGIERAREPDDEHDEAGGEAEPEMDRVDDPPGTPRPAHSSRLDRVVHASPGRPLLGGLTVAG